MSSPWDLFGDDDDGGSGAAAAPPRAAPDPLACAHPFFAALRGGDDGAPMPLRDALATLAREAPQLARSCAAELDAGNGDADGVAAAALREVAAGVAAEDALLSDGCAAAAASFAAAACAQLASRGWPCAAWDDAHTLCRVLLASHELRRGDAATALRSLDEALLASCRASAEAYAGGPARLRGVLPALLAAAAAAAPPPSASAAACVIGAQLPAAALRRSGGAPVAAAPVVSVPYDGLSVPDFVNRFLAPGQPVVLSGLAADWPALSEWNDLGALCRAHAGRTVPVELSAPADADVAAADASPKEPRYAHSHGRRSWVSHVTLTQLLDTHLAPSVARTWPRPPKRAREDHQGDGGADQEAATSSSSHAVTAYLSQHSLLAQIPALCAAVRVPRLACGALRAANVWIGTSGTVTHLHTDDMQNILVQVAGWKLVRLYAPSGAQKRAHGSGSVGTDGGAAKQLAAALRSQPHPRAQPGALLNLFSAADAEAPAAELRDAYPALDACAPPLEALLGPGDALFIPRGAWHYVRALTPSISVNYWW